MRCVDLCVTRPSSADRTPVGRRVTSQGSAKMPCSTASRSVARRRRRVATLVSSHVTHHRPAKRTSHVRSRSSLLATVSGRRRRSSVMHGPVCLILLVDRHHSNVMTSVLDSSGTAALLQLCTSLTIILMSMSLTQRRHSASIPRTLRGRISKRMSCDYLQQMMRRNDIDSRQ